MDEKQQEMMYQMQMFEQQMQQIQQQMQVVEQGIAELNDLNKGLDDLVGKKDKEILAQVGRGIFVKAKLVSEDLTVDIGGKNFVKRNIPDTKKMIQTQIKKLEDVCAELKKSLDDLHIEIMGVIGGVEKGDGKKE